MKGKVFLFISFRRIALSLKLIIKRVKSVQNSSVLFAVFVGRQSCLNLYLLTTYLSKRIDMFFPCLYNPVVF